VVIHGALHGIPVLHSSWEMLCRFLVNLGETREFVVNKNKKIKIKKPIIT
jgi:hypothetical protein